MTDSPKRKYALRKLKRLRTGVCPKCGSKMNESQRPPAENGQWTDFDCSNGHWPTTYGVFVYNE